MLAHDHRNIVATAKWCSCPFPNLWAKGSSNKHGSAHLLKAICSGASLQLVLPRKLTVPNIDYLVPCLRSNMVLNDLSTQCVCPNRVLNEVVQKRKLQPTL